MTQLYLTMPQPGETITEGTIIKWNVKPGEQIKETTPIAELETEKAVFDYESPFTGTIIKILHGNGTRVKVAEPIAIVDVENEKAKTYIMMGVAKLVSEKQNQNPNNSFGCNKLKTSPYVRKIACEKNISQDTMLNLALDNNENRVTVLAVENYIKNSTSKNLKMVSGLKKETTDNNYTIKPCSAVRMRIANNMVLSKSKIPHAHTSISADVTSVIDYRNKYKVQFKKENGINLNFLSLIYKALAQAIKTVPVINASYDNSEDQHQIKIFNKINLGVAVGTEYGLVIPVIKDIANLSFEEFNSILNDKIIRAQNKKLMPDDLLGATLIFNNYGFFGTKMGVQVIQHPMSATLGMGVIEKRVVPIGDAIGIKTMTDFTLSFDHRVMDGRETGIFLSTLKKEIEGINL